MVCDFGILIVFGLQLRFRFGCEFAGWCGLGDVSVAIVLLVVGLVANGLRLLGRLRLFGFCVVV